MTAKMGDFLLNYYKQLNFNNMPPETRAQFDAYAKNTDFRGNMKDWNDNLIDTITRENKPLPNAEDPAIMDQGEWEKLFKAFQNAFRSMDADKKSFKDNKKANEFLKEYFTHTDDAGIVQQRLFSLFKAPTAIVTHINELYDLLKNSPFKDRLFSWLQRNGVFETRDEYNTFLNDVNSGKYNSDVKVRDKLTRVASYLEQADFSKNPALEARINSVNLAAITSGFDDTGAVNPDKLDYFKRNYNTLLKNLHTDTKVRDVFAEHDGGKITGPLKAAIAATDYTNTESKDYIPPKRTEELTLGQQISKWKADTFEDYLKKYATLRGDRLIFAPETGFIVKAIDGAKIKPTDGLEKVLSEAENIKKNLLYKSPKATDAFEYFTKIMGELKTTMPKTFAKALQNGTSLRAIVSEMIMHAVRNGKVAEAKIAMEILSVIKYGWCTSKVMETIGKEKVTIFSDTSLSWNKFEGTKFVTTMLDRGIKTAFMGVGYGITVVGNAIRLSDNKFDGKPGAILRDLTAWRARNDMDHVAAETARSSDFLQRTAANDDLARTRSRGITEAALDAAVVALEADIAALTAAINANMTFFRGWVAANVGHPDHDALEDFVDTGAVPPPLTDPALQARMDAIITDYTNRNTKQKQLDRKKNKQQYFKDGTENIAFLDDQIGKRDTQLANWDDNHKDQYLELMAHWDFLEGGKTKSWSPLAKSTKQKSFDQTKIAQMAAWQNAYQYRT